MPKFSDDALKRRAFERIAWVLKHFYDEQAEDFKGDASLHTRVFETLIFPKYIEIIWKSENLKPGDNGYKEHVVPCAYIRNIAFRMYHDGRTEDDVAKMVRRILKIALLTPDEANRVDQKYKIAMPDSWDYTKDSITARLDEYGIKLVPYASGS
jgi:hypothetical protein